MIEWLSSLIDIVRELVGRERVRRRLLRAGNGVRISHSVDIRSPERLVLGSDIFIDTGVVLHCGGMDWSPAEGGISIGSRTYVGPNSVLFGGAGIEIGESVLISPCVVITSHQHGFGRIDVDIRDQPLKFGPVVIERNVWIGAGATILPGIRVGEGSVVGAAAVVTKDVPARTVVVGVPARAS
jgi:acetyltransferase-like isoleucine patch superfamily enzyme